MKPTREEVKKYLEKEGLKEKDLNMFQIKNLYSYGSIEPQSEPVFLPRRFYEIFRLRAETKGISVDQEVLETLQINVDVLKYQFNQKNR